MAVNRIFAQDTNGTFDCNVTSWTDVPYNNLITETDDTVIEQTSTTEYELKVSGNYLVMYNIVTRNDTYGNRILYLGRLELEGAGLAYGRSQGYRRNAGNDRAFLNGSTISDQDYISNMIRYNFV